MTPGSILHYTNYTFLDGSQKNKYIVLLSNGEGYPYVVTTTTSKRRSRNMIPGCQSSDYYPNFFLLAGTDGVLPKDTWIELEGFNELDQTELLKRKFENVITVQGHLSTARAKALLQCALYIEDITLAQESAIKSSLATLQNN